MHNIRTGTSKILKSYSSLPNSPVFSRRQPIRRLSGSDDGKRSGIILGIETSCDDTGVAVVTTERKVLGEALHSQLQIHLK